VTLARLLPLALVAVLVASCSSEPPTAQPSTAPTATVSPTPLPPQLVPLGSFSNPVWAGVAPGDDKHLYLAEKNGRVLRLDRAGRVLRTVLDLRPQISREGGEQGLLSIAFDPGFATNNRMYAYFTDKDGDNRVQAFTVWNGVAIVPQDLLNLTRPYPNHNGGSLVFDRTGMLVVSTGDGGSAGDPDERAQRLASPFGKLLRLDPRTGEGAAGNPFPAYPKVWAFGLRNPWRFSFDTNGDLYLGDVGQSTEEELNVVPPDLQSGANYGWSVYEGNHVFKPKQVLNPRGQVVVPALTYQHKDAGCFVVGGHVYRGRAVPSLAGSYVFGDFCIGRVWAVERTARGVTPYREVGVRVQGLQAFGVGHRGELLVMSAEQLFRLASA
jgi:glucose/arabinose dehydrogenase